MALSTRTAQPAVAIQSFGQPTSEQQQQELANALNQNAIDAARVQNNPQVPQPVGEARLPLQELDSRRRLMKELGIRDALDPKNVLGSNTTISGL